METKKETTFSDNPEPLAHEILESEQGNISGLGDTQDTPAENPPTDPEVKDTTDEAMAKYVEAVFGKADKKISSGDEDMPDDKDTTDDNTSDNDDKPKDNHDDKDDGTIITLKDNDFEKVVDLKKEEDYNYVIQHANKGLNYERKMQEINKQRSEMEMMQANMADIATGIAYRELYLISKGLLDDNSLNELPYESFIGKGESEQEDLKMWNEHNRAVKQRINDIATFQEKYKKGTESLTKVVNSFKESHPEIEDVNNWIKNNVAPYQLPVLTHGAVEYPNDTFEMIYFWKNKDKIITAIKEKAIKEYVKKAPVIKGQPTTQKAAEISGSDTQRRSLFGDSRKLTS